MKKQNVTIFYGLVMATYSVGFVTMSAFSSLYLLDIGLTNSAVGVLLAIASMVSVALQPIVGILIDKNPKISTKTVLLVLGFLVAVLGVLIILMQGKSIGLITGLYGTGIMVLMLAQPFLNALGMDAINYGYPINFGVGRSMGSLGYALGSFAFGRISVITGPKSVPVVFSTAFFVLCIMLFICPIKKDLTMLQKKSEDADAKTKNSPIAFVKRYKRFAVLLLSMIFVYFSHSLINSFTLQIVMPKNGTSADMGTATAIAAVCELITMIIFPFYMKHIKLHNILRIGSVFFVLKILFSFIVPNMIWFFIIQGFQMFGWGFMSMGIVYYVNNIVGDYDKAQGQAYAGMSFTTASVLATFLGGYMIDNIGVSKMLLVGTAVAAVGTVILWFAVEEIKGKIKV